MEKVDSLVTREEKTGRSLDDTGSQLNIIGDATSRLSSNPTPASTPASTPPSTSPSTSPCQDSSRPQTLKTFARPSFLITDILGQRGRERTPPSFPSSQDTVPDKEEFTDKARRHDLLSRRTQQHVPEDGSRTNLMTEYHPKHDHFPNPARKHEHLSERPRSRSPHCKSRTDTSISDIGRYSDIYSTRICL